MKILKIQSRKHCKIVELPSLRHARAAPGAPRPPSHLPLPKNARAVRRAEPLTAAARLIVSVAEGHRTPNDTLATDKMGLTKQYLKYVPADNANIISSSRCNVVFVKLDRQEGRFVAAIYIWDLRLGEKAHVTCLVASPSKKHIAFSYADGTVKMFDLSSSENVSILWDTSLK